MSTSLSITGKLFSVNPPEQKKETFKVRIFIIELSESTNTGQVYNNYITLQLVNEKCALLDTIVPGSQITAHFNLRGNLYEGKAITNLQVWKIDVQQAAYQQPQQPQYAPPAPQYQQPAYPPQGYPQQGPPPPYQPAPQQAGWPPPQQPAQYSQPQPPAQPGAPTWGNQQNNNNSGLPF